MEPRNQSLAARFETESGTSRGLSGSKTERPMQRYNGTGLPLGMPELNRPWSERL